MGRNLKSVQHTGLLALVTEWSHLVYFESSCNGCYTQHRGYTSATLCWVLMTPVEAPIYIDKLPLVTRTKQPRNMAKTICFAFYTKCWQICNFEQGFDYTLASFLYILASFSWMSAGSSVMP